MYFRLNSHPFHSVDIKCSLSTDTFVPGLRLGKWVGGENHWVFYNVCSALINELTVHYVGKVKGEHELKMCSLNSVLVV